MSLNAILDAEQCVVRFDDVELTFRTSDGYVNATKLCSLGGRHWKHYLELDGTGRIGAVGRDHDRRHS